MIPATSMFKSYLFNDLDKLLSTERLPLLVTLKLAHRRLYSLETQRSFLNRDSERIRFSWSGATRHNASRETSAATSADGERNLSQAL